MLLKSIINEKKRILENLDLNKFDTVYAQYQLIILCSMINKETIADIETKNKLYRIKKNTEDVMKLMKVKMYFSSAIAYDEAIITKAEIIAQEFVVEEDMINRKRIKGCVAILDLDYQ